jgi:hypothetical protein
MTVELGPASPAVQTPAVHAPAGHSVPSGFVGFEHLPEVPSHVPAVWQSSSAVHATAMPCVQTPALQASPLKHELLSLHDVPSGSAGLEHMPVVVLHVPAAWQLSAAAHVTGLVPMQTPAVHVSVCVHALPSLHVAPSALVGFEQTPVLVLHAPTAWHVSIAVHVTGLVPVHVPAMHASVCVQALPSLQLVPSALDGFEQVPLVGSHVPTSWQASIAVHVTGFEPTQVPAMHASICVQALPSLQLVPSALTAYVQVPDEGSHDPAMWH